MSRDNLESFQTFSKVFRQRGKFSDNNTIFQAVWKVSRQPESFWKALLQNLSGQKFGYLQRHRHQCITGKLWSDSKWWQRLCSYLSCSPWELWVQNLPGLISHQCIKLHTLLHCNQTTTAVSRRAYISLFCALSQETKPVQLKGTGTQCGKHLRTKARSAVITEQQPLLRIP